MKINLLSLVGLSFSLILFGSCKDNKNETEANEAEMAAEAPATATKYMVENQGSMISWMGSKPTGKHKGTIKVQSGFVKVEGDSISGSFLIDMKSINVTDLEGEQKANLENHLKGTVEGKEVDFFNVDKFPTADFEITSIKEEDGKKIMSGNLTLKDAKKNISFPITYAVDGENMTLKSEPFTIDRTQWNINYGSKSLADTAKDAVISDDIELTIDIKAKKQM